MQVILRVIRTDNGVIDLCSRNRQPGDKIPVLRKARLQIDAGGWLCWHCRWSHRLFCRSSCDYSSRCGSFIRSQIGTFRYLRRFGRFLYIGRCWRYRRFLRIFQTFACLRLRFGGIQYPSRGFVLMLRRRFFCWRFCPLRDRQHRPRTDFRRHVFHCQILIRFLIRLIGGNLCDHRVEEEEQTNQEHQSSQLEVLFL